MIARTEEATRNGCTPMSTRRATADGASFVCSVLKTRWPVRLALVAMDAVSKSRISPIMMMFGAWRRIERNAAGKGHADVRIHLHLVDAVHLILDRLLDGDDLAVGLVDVIEAGVERARFARTGRAGDEQDAVGQTEQPLEDFLVVAQKSELGQTEHQARFVEHTHDDAFAVIGRDGRDAQIDRLAARSSPGCGRPAASRFSAMLIEPVMILSRLTMADCKRFGGACISWSTPSMRKRTRNFLSSGSR